MFDIELIFAASSVLMVWVIWLGTSFLGSRDDSIILQLGIFVVQSLLAEF